MTQTVANLPNLPHLQQRIDMAAAFRWTARLNARGRGKPLFAGGQR